VTVLVLPFDYHALKGSECKL
jgi:integrase